MTEEIAVLSAILAAVAAIFAFLAYRRAGGPRNDGLTLEQISQLFRTELDQIRRAGEEQARTQRQELSANLVSYQDIMLKVFRELGDGLGQQVRDFGIRLDAGIQVIDQRVAAIGMKLGGVDKIIDA